MVMGRRSAHTAEELRELIIQAATELIQESGFGGLSAREIARRISYSPGTLYNVFEDLDDLVLTIEGRLLDQLTSALTDIPPGGDAGDKVRRLAEVYVAFTRGNPKLWNLLFEHHLPAGREVPAWYQQKLEGLMSKVEEALQPLVGEDVDPEMVRRSAKTLWAGVHGITSLSTADKLSIISTDSAGDLLDDLVSTHLAGLEAMRHRQAAASP
jgi:AcrR family transcriptional regulator